MDHLQAALDAVALAVDNAEWERARLCYEWRAERVPSWADRIGRHRHIRRSPRTVMGWAQAYECWHKLDLAPVIMRLPFSWWESWHKYIGDEARNEKLIEIVATYAAEPGGTGEGLAAALSEEFGDESVSANGAHPLLRWPTTVAPRDGNFIVELDGESWTGVSEVKIKAVKG